MNLFKKSIAAFGMLIAALLVFTACETESLEANLSETEYAATEDAMAMAAFAGEPLPGEKHHRPMLKGLLCDNWKEKLPECAILVESGTAFPKTISISFPEECKGPRGRSPKGKIVITINKPIKERGAIKTIKFYRMGEDGHEIVRSRTIENAGLNKAGNYQYLVSTNFSVDGKRGQLSRRSQGTIEVLAGFSTEDCDDDKLSITGTSEGKGPRGDHSRTIIEPIVRDPNCKHPISGLVQVEGPKGTFTIDFGDGDCDSKATITKNGEEKEIDLDEMPRKRHPKRRR